MKNTNCRRLMAKRRRICPYSSFCLRHLCLCYRILMAKRLRVSNNFARQKCPIREDRISQLPDDILVRILSLSSLNTKEAADTSVISKRWLHLWRYIPRLDFDATEPSDELAMYYRLHKKQMRKYVRWINLTLRKCKVHTLEKFRVRFDLHKPPQHVIDKWLEFAFARKVQRLELDLSIDDDERQDSYVYAFPLHLLGLGIHASQPLHKFSPLWHNLKALKVLEFKAVNVTGEVLEFFLHNCPFLEEMMVEGSGTLVNLEVVGPSLNLKHLEIWYCHNLESFKICDTNLVTLGTSLGDKLLLQNVPKLIEVQILGNPSTHIVDDILPWVSSVLSQLEVLVIHAYKGLEYLEHYKFPELTKLKKFVVFVEAWEDMSVLGCTSVVGAAPQLEEFELHLIWDRPTRSNRECEKAVRCTLHHLKVLRLIGYYGRTSELELVRYFLENAIALEKIIVEPRSEYDYRVKFILGGIEEEQMARSFAKTQLESEVPPHIKLVIL